MNDVSPKRSAASVLLMINVAEKYGIRRQACLAGTGLTIESLQNALTRQDEIYSEQELSVIENIVEHNNNSALAIEIGRHYHLTTYGIFGFALSTSPNVRAAIEIGLNYLPLTFAFSQFKMTEVGELGYMSVEATQVAPKIRRFVVERDMVAMLSMHQEIFGLTIPLEGIEFQWPASSDANIYTSMFSQFPRFNQNENRVIFNKQLLTLALPTANEKSRAMFVAQCQDLMQQRHHKDGIAFKVRHYLLANINQGVRMDDIAAEQCVSLRTLRRQLKEEGTSFRILTDEVREMLSIRLIQQTTLTMDQIAARLGYSDTANFFHAFKRWTGYPPKHFRRNC